VPIDSFVARKLRRFEFYARGVLRDAIPYPIYAIRLRRLYAKLEATGLDHRFAERVHYYNKLAPGSVLQHAVPARSISNEGSYYLYDLREHLNYFPPDLQVYREFGDVAFHLQAAGLTKTRPIADTNQNSVLLKLDKLRHFTWPRDPYPFASKINAAVWRGALHNELRRVLVQRFYAHPRHNIGLTENGHGGVGSKPWLSPAEQFRYRYMVSVEGVDVATNLKMVLASRSLCLMPRPRYESWLMEGTLVPGVHYVELRDDFADLDNKIDHYERHQDEALAIVANANRFMEQFGDKAGERLISILVLQKYFENTGQLPSLPVLRR
jgi:hypothetical protein